MRGNHLAKRDNALTKRWEWMTNSQFESFETNQKKIHSSSKQRQNDIFLKVQLNNIPLNIHSPSPKGPVMMSKTMMASCHSITPNSPTAFGHSCIDAPLFYSSGSVASQPVVLFWSPSQWFHHQPHWANKPQLMRPSVDVQEVMVAVNRSFALASQHRVNYDSSSMFSMGIK